jgi:hypothetical protein
MGHLGVEIKIRLGEKKMISTWILERVEVAPNTSKNKYIAVFRRRKRDGDTTIERRRTPFGARGYEDYTMHKDKDRREKYRIRHAKDLRTGDPTRAGFLSYYILWGDTTSLRRAVQQYRERFGMRR